MVKTRFVMDGWNLIMEYIYVYKSSRGGSLLYIIRNLENNEMEPTIEMDKPIKFHIFEQLQPTYGFKSLKTLPYTYILSRFW